MMKLMKQPTPTVKKPSAKTATSHTMDDANLDLYCKSKIHPIFTDALDVKNIHIVPIYDRTKTISVKEKNDKLFNHKRPTAEIIDGEGFVYVFPGKDYVRHYAKIYRQQGFDVTVHDFDESDIRAAVASVFPKKFPTVDTVVLGYVQPLVDEGEWQGDNDIFWKVQQVGNASVAFVGVEFSYWGDIIYYVIEQLAKKTKQVIYIGKLGSLDKKDIPNKTIASGNISHVDGKEVQWKNIFEKSPLITKGKHISIPSVLDETHQWFLQNRDEYRFVDPEIGWAAKSCQDNDTAFSYLHLVTDNLHGHFIEDLTNERDKNVLEKRLQYVGIIKAILWHAIANEEVSLSAAVLQAQQVRVDRGLMRPLQRDWQACLSFAYHTQEEAWEIVRELPRREWKDQEVVPERLLSEIVDTQIQLLTTLAYAGFSEQDLIDGVLEKLQAKRKDWK